ncbi:MAG TPA: zinc-ribbon domain containing protein [Terracidiphilus sp.]|nr:zinc-ribbon domain containing protein [Terracidiphilus sp.]
MNCLDRNITCISCGLEFVFTADEQAFFFERHFKNIPRHCKRCNAKRRGRSRKILPETQTTCAECGIGTTVPFKPTQGRRVLCRSCFQKPLSAPSV